MARNDHRNDRTNGQGLWAAAVLAVAVAACGSGGGGDAGVVTPPAGDAEAAAITEPHGRALATPPAGSLYHGVFPGDDETIPGAEEDGVTAATLQSYETAVGKAVAWVYFSHNWYGGRTFPLATATWIRDHGSIPFIRLMLRSSAEQDVAEPLYTPARIAAGDFDEDLWAWGEAAAAFDTALLVEYGTEVNGNWFAWNGAWNGGASGGAAAFRAAYRHIVRVISAAGAANVTWAFHVGAQDVPEEPWNRFENYYPGDDAVDWVGVSVYGAEDPLDDEWLTFRGVLDAVYPRLTTMARDKPVAVLELGVSGGNPLGSPETWAADALADLVGGRWPAVVGFSWWNEMWQNDADRSHDTDMRVQTVPGLAAAVGAGVAPATVLGVPVVQP